MKTLRRPMFRKGGEVGGGIMTGVMRENYQQGTTAERLMKVAGQPAGFDPLTQFLIQGGLSLASQPATGGGAIADIATAVQKPAADLMTGLGERDKMRQQLALKGELLDIEQEGAEKLAKIKQQNQVLNERKKAIAAAGPKREGETEEDYLKRIDDLTAKLILSGVTSAENVQKRFEIGQKTEALNDIYERYGLTAGPAESFYKFQTTIAPGLTERLNKQFMGPIKKDSKGKYKTRNKQAGIYYDPFAKQAVLLEATGEVQLID
jgi:hypothetical protein